MNIGLIGPPKSGKTTTFHLLTGTEIQPHESFKREVRHGVSHVPDMRVDRLATISASRKKTYVTVEYLDTPGLEAGAAKSEWFAAAMEAGIRNSEALLLVVRAFGSEELDRGIDLRRDILGVQEELILADMILLENRLERLQKQRRVKPPTPEEKAEMELLTQASQHLAAGHALRTMNLHYHERKSLRGFQFLSEKPLLAVVNAAEDSLPAVSASLRELDERLSEHQIHGIALSAKLEGEIARLEGEERAVFMEEIGVSELARDRVLKASFDLLGLITFLTTGEKETRAWPLRSGETARDAAAEIHTDLARGFIRAEVVGFDDFVREGGYPGCKAKGLLRLEGKEYPVKDGDVLLIRHSG